MPEIRASLERDIAELDRRVRELRGARHSLTYDLEQCLLERERLQMNLNNVLREEGRGA